MSGQQRVLDRIVQYSRERAKDCNTMADRLKEANEEVGAEVVRAKAEAFGEMTAAVLRIREEEGW